MAVRELFFAKKFQFLGFKNRKPQKSGRTPNHTNFWHPNLFINHVEFFLSFLKIENCRKEIAKKVTELHCGWHYRSNIMTNDFLNTRANKIDELTRFPWAFDTVLSQVKSHLLPMINTGIGSLETASISYLRIKWSWHNLLKYWEKTVLVRFNRT